MCKRCDSHDQNWQEPGSLRREEEKAFQLFSSFEYFHYLSFLLLRLIAFDPMVSRKKAKGRARRAVKEANVAEEGKVDDKAAAVANQDGSLEAQMQRLTIDDLLKECSHGFEFELDSDRPMRIVDFIKTFEGGYEERTKSGENDMMSCFRAGIAVTRDTFADIWESADKLRQVISFKVSFGTYDILLGKVRQARTSSFVAYFFEQYIAAHLENTQHIENWQQILELHNADLHTLVGFFRKRTPCKCLDKKYKEVKSITKMGVCSNPGCPLPMREAPRASMFSCAGCNIFCYCGGECQRAHWPMHKEGCKQICTRSWQL